MDHHYENKVSGKENGENSEEDLDYDPESYSEIYRKEISVDRDDNDESPPDLQERSDESDINSDDEWDAKTFVDIIELQVKKRRTTAFSDLDSDSEFNDERDTEWKSRNENRETKTPDPRRIVRLTNEVERSIDVDASNVETHYDGHEQQAVSRYISVNPLEEASVKFEESSPGVKDNGPRRSGRVRSEPHRHSSFDCSK